jgi:hypothetical protein
MQEESELMCFFNSFIVISTEIFSFNSPLFTAFTKLLSDFYVEFQIHLGPGDGEHGVTHQLLPPEHAQAVKTRKEEGAHKEHPGKEEVAGHGVVLLHPLENDQDVQVTNVCVTKCVILSFHLCRLLGGGTAASSKRNGQEEATLEDRKIKLLVLSDDNKVSEGGGWNIIPQFSNFFFLHIII